jgi:hypothetical protein
MFDAHALQRAISMTQASNVTCFVCAAIVLLQVLGEFVGPTFSVQLKPVRCPIYADPVTGRSYVSFADCDPAQLVISATPRK